MNTARSLRAAMLLTLALAFRSGADETLAISPAEASAVETAAAFLERGSEAIYERLASSSPLRAMAKEDALAEIEVRVGPHAGASWELQTVVPALQNRAAAFNVSYPSGVDESVVFEFVQEGGKYVITDIRMLAQKSATPQIFAAKEVTKAAATAAPTSHVPLMLGVVLVALALAAGSAFAVRPSPSLARTLLLFAAIAGVAAIAVAVQRDPRFAFAKVVKAKKTIEKKDDYPRLAALLPLRRAMTSGAGEVDAAYRGVPVSLKPIAALWKAQHDLQSMHTKEVAAALKKFPSPSDIPLVEILRARLAYFQNRESDSIVAYESAVNLGPGRDGLWFETAQALSTLGFDSRAERYLQRLARIGSRNADVHYGLAVTAALDNDTDKAEAQLQRAWSMRPVPRESLVRMGVFWDVLRRPSVSSQISMSSAAEATFAAQTMSSRPLAIPLTAMTRVSGDYLHMQIGAQELSVPGGASLAPIGTPVVDAATWTRVEQEKGLADYAQVSSIAHTAGAYAQPVLRRRIERSVSALAANNRWSDLVQLTDGISPKSEHVPVELFFHRANALLRMQRRDDAKRLLVELAASPVLARKRDAKSMEKLADMLASVDLYDAAIQQLDRAATVRQNPMIDERARQIAMSKRLATGYATHTTPHFELHYPNDLSPVFAQQVADILEKEQARLQKWIPLPDMRRVVVNIMQWQDFRSTYTGSDFILGFYNGSITVPLAGVPEFVPEVVALLTHELCHAMLAQATNDQAPHWFQEGVAQRVEMRRYHPNALNMYDDERLISVSLLDAVITGSPDPEMISEAYIESQTIIRYVEEKYGADAVKKLTAAFREGANTDAAIRQVSGLDVAQFDTNFRTWGRAGAKVFDNPEPVRYDYSTFDQIRLGRRTNP